MNLKIFLFNQFILTGLVKFKEFYHRYFTEGILFFFEERKILKNDFTKSQIQSFKKNEGIVIGKKLANKLRLN